jgi:ribosomal-protein-alanine N-acetyltransferase
MADLFADLDSDLSRLPVLDTERCLLREAGEEHASDLFAVYGDADGMKYMQRPVAESVAECADLIRSWREEFLAGRGFRWGVFLRERPDVLIGTAALHYWSPEDRRVELGADLSRNHWGKGIGTEVTVRLISHGFRVLAANRIELRCHPRNSGAVEVASRLGFVFEGNLREYVMVPGKGLVDETVFSILAREWKG